MPRPEIDCPPDRPRSTSDIPHDESGPTAPDGFVVADEYGQRYVIEVAVPYPVGRTRRHAREALALHPTTLAHGDPVAVGSPPGQMGSWPAPPTPTLAMARSRSAPSARGAAPTFPRTARLRQWTAPIAAPG